MTEDQLWDAVRAAGQDVTTLRAAARGERAASIVARDISAADWLGVRGTPTTFIEGHRHDGALTPRRLLDAIVTAGGTSRPR